MADRPTPTGPGPDNPDGIEITPEMIAAGRKALTACRTLKIAGPMPYRDETLVREIYLAMRALAR